MKTPLFTSLYLISIGLITGFITLTGMSFYLIDTYTGHHDTYGDDALVLKGAALVFSLLFFGTLWLLHRRTVKLKRKNKELKALKKKYEQAMTSAHEGIIEYDHAAQTFLLSNSWRHLLGYPTVQNSLSREAMHALFHPDDVATVETHFQALLQPDASEKEHIVRMKHADGSWRWILCRGVQNVDAQGDPTGFTGMQLDVTQLQQLKLLLESKEQEFTRFMEHIPASIMICDGAQTCLYDNGYLKPVFDVLGTNALQEIRALSHELKRLSFVDKVFTFTQGATTYHLRAIAFRIGNSPTVSHVGYVVLDITDTYALARELHEKEELMISQSRYAAMGEMLSMIAHQWRQPITVIAMGANNMLADLALGTPNPEEFQAQTLRILEQIDHLSQTIDDFSNYFKPDTKPEWVTLEGLIDRTIQMIKPSFAARDIEITTHYEAVEPIYIHVRELVQVMLNIFNNAKEALEQIQTARILSVSMTADTQSIYLDICNNAGPIGEAMPYIFEPYFTTKEEQNGTGLGLYICKTIVEKHLHGTINARDVENHSVCFTLTLPREPHHDGH